MGASVSWGAESERSVFADDRKGDGEGEKLGRGGETQCTGHAESEGDGGEGCLGEKGDGDEARSSQRVSVGRTEEEHGIGGKARKHGKAVPRATGRNRTIEERKRANSRLEFRGRRVFRCVFVLPAFHLVGEHEERGGHADRRLSESDAGPASGTVLDVQ